MVWKYEQRVQSSLEHGLLSSNTKRHHFNLTMRLPESGRGLQDGVKGHGWNEKIGKMEPHQALSPLALCAAGSRGQKPGLWWGRGVRVATGVHPWAPSNQGWVPPPKKPAFPGKNQLQVPFWLLFIAFFDAFSRVCGQKKGKNGLF